MKRFSQHLEEALEGSARNPLYYKVAKNNSNAMHDFFRDYFTHDKSHWKQVGEADANVFVDINADSGIEFFVKGAHIYGVDAGGEFFGKSNGPMSLEQLKVYLKRYGAKPYQG